MTDLWILLISAQNSENGIVIHILIKPEDIIKEKKEEIRIKTEQKMDKLKFLEKMLDKKDSPEKITNTDIKKDIDKKSIININQSKKDIHHLLIRLLHQVIVVHLERENIGKEKEAGVGVEVEIKKVKFINKDKKKLKDLRDKAKSAIRNGK